MNFHEFSVSFFSSRQMQTPFCSVMKSPVLLLVRRGFVINHRKRSGFISCSRIREMNVAVWLDFRYFSKSHAMLRLWNSIFIIWTLISFAEPWLVEKLHNKLVASPTTNIIPQNRTLKDSHSEIQRKMHPLWHTWCLLMALNCHQIPSRKKKIMNIKCCYCVFFFFQS